MAGALTFARRFLNRTPPPSADVPLPGEAHRTPVLSHGKLSLMPIRAGASVPIPGSGDLREVDWPIRLLSRALFVTDVCRTADQQLTTDLAVE